MGRDEKYLKHAVTYYFITVCEYLTPKNTETYFSYSDSTTNLYMHISSTTNLPFLFSDAREQKLGNN
jgi:hypothetical protein